MTRRQRSVDINGFALVTSDDGVKKASSSVQRAGVDKCQDLTIALSSAGTPVLMANNTVAAWRVLWGYRDEDNNLIYGPPSARIVMENAAGATRDASITVRCVSGATTSWFYQIYRTTIVSNTLDPGDEMALVFEGNPTSAQLGAGSLTVVDITPDVLRGDALYTNATQEGIENANDPPPKCTDLVVFREMVGYANTTDQHALSLQLIGMSGLTTGTSTITIGGVVYTCQTTETAASGNFAKVTTGTTAQQIEKTAQSLCRVINGYSANTVYEAFYLSTPDTIPGTIFLRRRDFVDTAITVTANSTATGNSFSPPIPTSGTAYASTQEKRRNEIRWSKPGEPEAVPVYRATRVGSEADEIQRVIALRDAVIVVKNNTIYRITGSVFEDLTVSLLDNTTSCAGRDSYAVLNNTVFGLSNQGFIAITDNGVQIVGRPEEHRVLAMLEDAQAPDHDTFVATGIEQQRLYVCAAHDPELDIPVAWVYNAISRAWSRWNINASCMTVHEDRLLYGLGNAYGHVLQQRSSLRDGDPAYRDFADDAATYTIATINTTTNVVTGTLSNAVNYDGYNNAINIGSKLYDGTRQYLVTNVAGSDLTLNTTVGLTVGAKTLYRSIPMLVGWQPRTGGNPGELKQFGDVLFKSETQNLQNVLAFFYSEIDTKTHPAWLYYTFAGAVPATTVYVSPDGSEPSENANDFTAEPGLCVPNNTIRTQVPLERSICEHLEVRLYNDTAEGRLAIKALALDVRPTDTMKGRT